MKKIGEFVTKHKIFVIIVSLLLLIPTIIGIKNTRINYDILVYLPDDIETMKGQEILKDDFDMGAFSISIIDNMSSKDIIKLEEKIRKIEGVNLVATIADVTGSTIPLDFLPTEITDKVIKDGSTLLFITFKDTTSTDETLNAVKEIRKLESDSTKIGGMTAMALDTMDLSNEEIIVYIIIAVILCIIVLTLFLDSYVVPVLLLANIGLAILYNMGTNVFLGEISYITKAISAVLQLGVTTDFSIFLYHKYEKSKKKAKDNNQAMSEAISETLVSVLGSSLTTIAGFLALCTMNLTLGKDIGIVMAKGVLFGLICVVTVFPSLLLIFDKWIGKTSHKPFVPEFKHMKEFVIKHYKLIFVIFLILIIPASIGNFNTKVYYKLDKSLPDTLDSIVANNELKEKFNIVSPEIILLDKNIKTNAKEEMISKLKEIDGIDFVLSGTSLSKYGIDEILSEDITKIYKSDKYEMIFFNSLYDIATDELNNQIDEVNKLVKKYDKNAIIAGEGPLMKDLVQISDQDFKNVNYSSLAVIFVIMMFVLKSISLPVILICAIEFAIFINMGIPYYTNTTIPFIASIVIGTIQLGATIDYAILMTTKYLEKRQSGKDKFESIKSALNNSVSSIFVSGMCFFAATIGVGVYSKLEMIGSLCTLISRGAIISMLVVILVLPSLLLMFDKIICKTSLGFGGKNMKNVKKLGCLLLLCGMFGINNVSALTKEETVYTKLNADGSIKNTIVNEHLISKDKTINDVTNLKDILNINGDETFELNNNNIVWNNLGNDIFYRGTTTKNLPIETSITYKLNGEVKNAKDMLGKKGKVEIVINFKNNSSKDVLVNGTYQTMYTPFVVTMGTILNNNNSDINITNGKVVSTGTNNMVVALATPNLGNSLGIDLDNLNQITLSYTTKSFSLSSMYFVISPRVLNNIDLSVFDKMDVIYSKVNTLSDSSKLLVNGSKQLLSGTTELKGGIELIKSSLDNSISSLENSAAIDNATLSYIQNLAVTKAKEQIVAMENSIRSSAETKAIEGLTEEKINQIYNGVIYSLATNPYYLDLASNPTKKAELDGIIKSVVENVSKIVAKSTASDVAYQTSIEVATSTASSLSSMIATNVAETAKTNTIESLKTLSAALVKLSDGATSLNNGATELSTGLEKFDSEGISAITSLVNNNLKGFEERAKALVNLSKEYSTFTMKNSDTIGTTKFINVIDSVSK